jgi:hypothetical protein
MGVINHIAHLRCVSWSWRENFCHVWSLGLRWNQWTWPTMGMALRIHLLAATPGPHHRIYPIQDTSQSRILPKDRYIPKNIPIPNSL